jgi:hypothetical protein
MLGVRYFYQKWVVNEISLEERCLTIRESGIMIGRIFFKKVKKCALYIQLIGTSEKNYMAMICWKTNEQSLIKS